MSDNNKNLDELAGMKDFAERYNHYLQAGEEDEFEENKKAEEKTSSDFEDISSYSDNSERSADDVFGVIAEAEDSEAYEDNEENTVAEKTSSVSSEDNFFSRNHYRNAKITALIVVIALLLGSGGFLLWFWYQTKGAKYSDNGLEFSEMMTDEYGNPIPPQELYPEEAHQSMGDVSDSNSLNQWLKNWALNGGEKMSSKNVINVLLCGVDSTDGTASKARSDSMILVSVNKKKKTISMISLLRDSWTYMSLPREDGSHYDYYFKMNGAYSLGGPATLVETIENNFKIEIDQYIAVDFASFKKLIDALGGVTVEVTKAESDYIRRTSSQKNFPVGKAKLNGTQALIYSRIRYLDDDLMRTGRQRKIIKSLIESAKTATNGQLLNAFKLTSGYIRTGYSQSEVMSLISQAYTYKWMDYDMVEKMLPNEDYVDRFSTYIGIHWVWVVDFVLCAKTVQETIYGESNIILAENRTSALDFVTKNAKSSGSYSGGSTQQSTSKRRTYDYDYDEPDYDEPDNDYGYDEPDYDEPTRSTESQQDHTTEAYENEPTASDGGDEGGENTESE